jgi:arginyl-tRNA synthetase
MIELAENLRTQYGETLLQPEGDPPPPELGAVGIAGMLRRIRDDLESLGVHYDVWFSERSLYGESRRFQTIMDVLAKNGYVAEKEGAVWFTSTDLGEDKDNVLVRRDGTPTYFASDIAYHYDKFIERKFGKVIDIWGADHQGHVSRLKAAVSAIDADPNELTILLYQLVMVKGGRLSKRAGNIITLRELVSEVGSDACRFFFLSRSADSQMEFDLDLAKRQSSENPVYYVQYAHARIAGLLRTAEEHNVSSSGGDVRLLSHPTELALIRKMLALPELIETVARTYEPHHLPYYASELATAFHSFYTECKVVTEDEALTRARLRLTAAARVTLARVLHLMGMNAPERM